MTSVMHILNNPAFDRPGARRAAIETVVKDFVSYQDMARRSLGLTWTDLNDAQQRQFVDLFIQVLRDAVACRVNDYVSTQVVYLSEQRTGDVAEVRTLFKGDKVNTLISIRLVNRGGSWLMHDAVVDGVSLVSNYRAQFLHVIQQMSYVGLVDRIQANTLLSKTFERPGEP